MRPRIYYNRVRPIQHQTKAARPVSLLTLPQREYQDRPGVVSPAGEPSLRQNQLTISQPGDHHEQEADRMADRVVNGHPLSKQSMPLSPLPLQRARWAGTAQLAPPLVSAVLSSGGGQPMDGHTRQLMERRFEQDFSSVRIHTDLRAAESAAAIQALAYTQGNQIVFGAGAYSPNTAGGQRLLAHELTHVVQQKSVSRPAVIQRAVEIRPPGRGEASAFARRQEFIDRLNAQSPAIQYTLNGQALGYTIVNASNLTFFDLQMRGLIDNSSVIPMRLITRAGLVGRSPLLIDSLSLAYVDIDDMLASDNNSFQMNLIHLLVERSGIRNYERRIGTTISRAEFLRAHRAGIVAETAYLRSILSDPTIRFSYEEEQSSGNLVFGYRSSRGYQIFHLFRSRGTQAGQRGGSVFVHTREGNNLTIDEFLARSRETTLRTGSSRTQDDQDFQAPGSAPRH